MPLSHHDLKPLLASAFLHLKFSELCHIAQWFKMQQNCSFPFDLTKCLSPNLNKSKFQVNLTDYVMSSLNFQILECLLALSGKGTMTSLILMDHHWRERLQAKFSTVNSLVRSFRYFVNNFKCGFVFLISFCLRIIERIYVLLG